MNKYEYNNIVQIVVYTATPPYPCPLWPSTPVKPNAGTCP
jgi:hypothetical protein